jgi:signal transduction histidine kinase
MSTESSEHLSEALGALLSISGVLLAATCIHRSWRIIRCRLREEARIEAIALERERLAEDLHDHLGAELASIAAISDYASRLDSGDLQILKSLERIHRAAGASSRALGELIWLTKPANDYLPQLAAYLGDMACEMVDCTGISCRLEIPDDLPEIPVSYEVRRDLLMAVREMIGNSIRHSGTQSMTLVVDWRNDCGMLEVQVVDQGRGLHQRIDRLLGKKIVGGNGIHHIKSRVQKHRGDLQIVDGDPGLKVILLIPLAYLGADGLPVRVSAQANCAWIYGVRV